MKKIDNYISEKLHINKDYKVLDKGTELTAGGYFIFTVIDFISCKEEEDELFNFVMKYDKKEVWVRDKLIDIKTNKFNPRYFKPEDYEYLVYVKDQNDDTSVFLFGGKNKHLKYA